MANTNVGDVLLICLLPVGTMLLGSIIVAYFQPGPKLTSAMQHFAAGIVLAAVSIELMPELALQMHGQNGVYTISMVLGFSSAVGILFLISRYFDADNNKEEKPKEKNDTDLKPDSITDVEMSQLRSTTPGMHLDINATPDGEERDEHEMASPQSTSKHAQPSVQPQQPVLQAQIPSQQPQSPPPAYTDINTRPHADSYPSHIDHMVYAHEDSHSHSHSHSHSSGSNSYGAPRMPRGIDGNMNYAPSPMMMNNGNNGYTMRTNYPPPPPPPPLPPAIPAPPMSISMNEAAHQYAYECSNNGYEPSYSHHHENQGPQQWQGYPHHEYASNQSSRHGAGWDDSSHPHPVHHEYDPWNDHNWNTRQRYRPSISLSHSQHTWQPRVRYASQWKNHGRSDIPTPSTSRNRPEHSINSRNTATAPAVPVAAATMPYMMHGTASTSLAKSIARSTTRAAMTDVTPMSTSASMNFKSSITTPGEMMVVPTKTSWNVPWGLIVAVGVDGATDGILIGIASAVGSGGIIVAVALAIEMSFLGISTSIEMNELNVPRKLQIPLLIFLPLFIMAGGAIGATVMSDVSGPIFVGFLSFGMAALLFLVTEELLVSAHEDLAHDTWFVSLQFFAGFLLVAIMEQYSGGGDMCSERVAEAFARQGLPAPP